MSAAFRIAAALWAALLASSGCERAIQAMDLERMREQDKVEVYEGSAMFPDGRGMRVPPVGTVPRERLLGPLELTQGVGAEGEVTEIPIVVERALLERGRDRFERFCAACHGVLGYGNPAIVENAELRPPPSLHDPEIRSQPPGRLFSTITLGYGLMPPYSDELPVGDRWAVIAYLPVLWTSQSSELAALPLDIQKEALGVLDARGGSR